MIESDLKSPTVPGARGVDNVARYERWGKWAAAVAAVGYLLLVVFKGEDRFGPIGDAMGPLTGVLTTLALFAAIEGVRLQREELKLQREELAASREVMREQARAAERSAETQERLAKAQEALAERQADANAIALMAKSVDLTAEVLRIDSRIAEVSVSGDPRDNAVTEKLKEVRRKVIALEDAFAGNARYLIRGSEANDQQSSTTQSPPPDA